jgi:hemerythrin
MRMRKTSELIWQDSQHQVLFEILDAIGQPEAGPEVILRLRQYAETHFMLEERYMERLAYPGLEAHRQAHDQFREEIAVLERSPEELDTAFRQMVSTYLTEWLKRHVFGVDKELEAFVLASPFK